jgi:DNA-binding SARP family transcriptional activator
MDHRNQTAAMSSSMMLSRSIVGLSMSQGAEDWRLHLLGPWELFRGRERVHVTLRQQRLIAALALLPLRPRAVLGELLWPESPNGQAAGNLRAALWRIRHELPSLLEFRDDDPRLCGRVRIDVEEFRHQLRDIGTINWVYDPGLVRLIYRAELLPGWYEDWLTFEQERIRRQRLFGLHTMCGKLLDAGNVPAALEAAILAVSIEPLSETSQTLLIQAQLEAGDYTGAVRQFHAFSDLLDRELGVEPPPRLHRMLYRGGANVPVASITHAPRERAPGS